MKSWKTTSGGIAQIIGAVCNIFNNYKTVGLLTVSPVDMALLLGGAGMIFARDNNVSSEEVNAGKHQPEKKDEPTP